MITLLNLVPYTDASVAPSPNHDARKSPAIHGIVLHATADSGNEAGTMSWMQAAKSGVSCHLYVNRGGQVTRFVGDHQRAWHAGKAWWRGTSDVNSITLGVEIANRNDGESYTDSQYSRVAEIAAHYCTQGLDLDDVVGHGSIAEDRRTDPQGWDWDRFRTLVLNLLQPLDVEGKLLNAYDRRTGRKRESGSGKPQALQRVSSSAHPASRIPHHDMKPVLCSKTIWLNGLTMLAAGTVLIGDFMDLAFEVGMTVPEEITMWLLFGVGVVNIVLRFRTSCPIGTCECEEHPPAEAKVRLAARAPVGDKGRAAAGPR